MISTRDHGNGPAVLLLHAFPCDGSMWEQQVFRLSKEGFRVVAPDLPGFADSPLLADPPDLDRVAEGLIELTDDLEISHFHLGGLSLGGYLAMALLRLAPERIDSLMLIDTKGTTDPEAALANRLTVAERVVAENSTEFLVPAMMPGLIGETSRTSRPDVVTRTEQWIRAAAPTTVAWYQRAMASRPDSLVDLANFSKPAAVIYGDEDLLLSPYAEQVAMADALPNGNLDQVVAAGHLSAVEQPANVSEKMVEFLRGVCGS
ncbi:MAG: alpha/beta hydrolase [Micrococcales bacterium]|nr:alpha/beta hydrolase [Micrococcales bacterium]